MRGARTGGTEQQMGARSGLGEQERGQDTSLFSPNLPCLQKERLLCLGLLPGAAGPPPPALRHPSGRPAGRLAGRT